jgi:phenylpropionate dioxygenase-like ring-hydroxylating dioxygenase large terminal subunit
MYVKNAWYVAAWNFEVAPDTILERTILGKSLIVFRGDDGAPAILENRCCHRFAPLSLGRKEGGFVRCMYHGLKFDAKGACVEIPGQAFIPANARVRSYPAVEHTRWIWVWMGDPESADESLIPDTFSLDHPEWRTKPGYKHFRAGMDLITDNLLDFSHLSFVHESTLGGSTAIAEAIPSISTVGGRVIRITRRVDGAELAPYHRRLCSIQGKVNRWWEYELSVSGMFIMNSGAQSVDKDIDDPSGALKFHSCQALTPETERSTHYFFSQAHNFALDDPGVTESVYDSIAAAFDEDLRMIEAQSKVIDGEGSIAGMVGIGADSALTRYRRMVRAAIEAEGST